MARKVMTRKESPNGKVTKKDTSRLSLLDGWKNFLDQDTLADRLALGKKLRDTVRRKDHAGWVPAKHRVSPIDLLTEQDKTRHQDFLWLKYERMLQSPFTFYRGAALIMANDLASIPKTNVNVQLSGDCHLSNFGVFATPERRIIFDLNDFDETLPGPFEWDLKRLAASFAVAAESCGFRKSVAVRCVAALSRVYRRKMAQYAEMTTLDVWYESIDWEFLLGTIKAKGRRQSAMRNMAKLKRKRTQAGAVAKLTEVIDGKRRIMDDPPLIFHPEEISIEVMKNTLHKYEESLWDSRRRLLQRYTFVDMAVKIVGVGSVGTVAGIVLLQGQGGPDDHIFLQIKQAQESVLERYLGKSQFTHPGQRVVNGQRLLQASSDLFLGWTSGPKRDFYIRQLMDLKASVPVEELDAITLEQYAEVCGHALARAHARTGDPAIISGYLGNSEIFDEALSSFALDYARQNEEDYLSAVDAQKKGKLHVKPKKRIKLV